MKIAMLTWDYWPGPEGGAERQCRGLSHELVRQGHQVTVLCAAKFTDAPASDNGVKIERFGLCHHGENAPSLLYSIFNRIGMESCRDALIFWTGLPAMRRRRRHFIQDLRAYFSQEELPDLIHVHETGWLAGLAAELAGPHEIPVLAKARNTPALEVIGYSVPCRARWARNRLACHWIALHEDLKEEMIREGVEPGSIHVVPNAVDVQEVYPKTDCRSPVVLCVGNLTQGSGHKGFDVLLRAWGRVHAEFPEARLILLGRGDPANLRELARICGCERSITFPGFVEEPGPYYQKADLFVLASRKEGMSNAFLEAQAHGLPAAVSDIPANRAVARDPDSCVLFPSGDAHALAVAIAGLLRDPDRRRRMGEAALRNSRHWFSREAVTQQLLGLYRNIIRKPS